MWVLGLGKVPSSGFLRCGIDSHSTCLQTSRGENIMSATTRILSLCLIVISAAGLLYGQGGAYGTILGTVKDNSGAVVAKAGVDVTNVATNGAKHTETTSSGDFTVPYLAPGTYRVTVQSAAIQKSGVD